MYCRLKIKLLNKCSFVSIWYIKNFIWFISTVLPACSTFLGDLLLTNFFDFSWCFYINIRRHAFVEIFLKRSEKKFDLIFADPPYGKIDYEWLFNSCGERISKNGKLVIEMNNNNFTFNNCVEKVYGETKVLFYSKI